MCCIKIPSEINFKFSFLLTILLFFKVGECVRCHKCTLIGLDSNECPSLMIPNYDGLGPRDKNGRIPAGLIGNPFFCQNGEACYIKESMFGDRVDPVIDAGCFTFASRKTETLIDEVLNYTKPMVCQTDVISATEKQFVCLCKTDLCNYGRKHGLANNPDMIDYAAYGGFLDTKSAQLCYKPSLISLWFVLINKIIL